MLSKNEFLTLHLLFAVALSGGVPFCEIACGPNATCVLDGKCVCLPGFIQTISEETGLAYCKALCETSCMEYAACVAPNECECVAGYEEHAGACVPTCQGDCTHGDCVAPNECVCHAGYVRRWELDAEVCAAMLTPAHSTSRGTTVAERAVATEATSLDDQSATSTANSDVYFGGIADFFDFSERREEAHKSSVQRNGAETTDKLPLSSEDTTTELTNTLDFNCPHDQVYYKGACRSTIKQSCNPALCGAHAYCDEHNECACQPGYELYESKSSKQQRCLLPNELWTTAVPVQHDQMAAAIKAIGWACIVLAMLALIFVLWRETKG